MFLRNVSAALMGCTLLLAPLAAKADRGPSTPEERRQALEYIHAWQADPLGPQAKDQFGWVLKWLADVPDLSVHVCMILDKLPKGDKKDGNTIFGAAFMAQAAFVIENPGAKADHLAEYQAGVEGALRVYEVLLKANPKDRQPYLDDLIQRRDAGTLVQFVKDRAAVACKN
jgi:hypothetical protein